MPFHRSTTSDTACGRKAQRPKGFGGEGPSAVLPLLARWKGIDFVAAPSIRPLGARNATAQTRDADSHRRTTSALRN